MPLLFWGPGSAGEGPERYSIRLPFTVSPDRKLDLPEEGSAADVEEYRVTILREDPGFRLAAEPFREADDAERAWPRLRAAILRAALLHRVGIRFPSSLDRAREYDQPGPIADESAAAPLAKKRGWTETDGDYDAGTPTIVPEHKRLFRFGAGAVRVSISLSAERLAEAICEGLTLSCVEHLEADEKLQLGLDLYTSSFFESSRRVKVVRLVTVLDALAEPGQTPPRALEAWGAARQLVAQMASGHEQGTPEGEHIQRLVQRMDSMRMHEESITHGIQGLVERGVAADPDLGDLAELQKAARESYTTRSTLLHDGVADAEEIATAAEFLNGFVPRLLSALVDAQDGTTTGQ